jgi:hypothetical protein
MSALGQGEEPEQPSDEARGGGLAAGIAIAAAGMAANVSADATMLRTISAKSTV